MSDPEKTEIAELLRDIDERQQGRHDVLQEQITNIDSLLRGTYKERGLITRVDVIEEQEASRKVWYQITVGAAVTSTVGALISWLKHVAG